MPAKTIFSKLAIAGILTLGLSGLTSILAANGALAAGGYAIR